MNESFEDGKPLDLLLDCIVCIFFITMFTEGSHLIYSLCRKTSIIYEFLCILILWNMQELNLLTHVSSSGIF